jgi:excisionase family DNA binding protein
MTAAGQPLVLTVEEAAALLRVSRGLAFAAVRAGTIPHLRIGRRILIPRSALYDLLRADPVTASEQ